MPRLVNSAALILLLTTSTISTADDHDDSAIDEALSAIPGQAALLLTELTDDGESPQPLFAKHTADRFAIGSSFKLYLLGTLAAEVNSGRRRLENTTTLQPRWIGPPHSELAGWPTGSPVTLQTLALKMISISDNTATDHLLHILGRQNVERQLMTMGHSNPEWNRPLLSTREMALLRDKSNGMPGREYQKLDLPQKRKFLADRFRGVVDYEQLDFDTAAFDLAEWYATPMDMARALTWLKQQTSRDKPAHPLRAVLAVDPKLQYDPAIWPYVGFKGGSEDQLQCGNWLLRNRNGHWYTLHIFCNSPNEMLDQEAVIQAMQEAFAVMQAEFSLN